MTRNTVTNNVANDVTNAVKKAVTNAAATNIKSDYLPDLSERGMNACSNTLSGVIRLFKFCLFCFLSIWITACNSLPKEPHVSQSIELSKLIDSRYAQHQLSNKQQVEKEALQTQPLPQDLAPTDQYPNFKHHSLDIHSNTDIATNTVTNTNTNSDTVTDSDSTQDTRIFKTEDIASTSSNQQPQLFSNTIDSDNIAIASATRTANNSQLSQSIDEQNQSHPNLSGYHTIVTRANAFAARSILTDMASNSIDVQYYIWHNDQAGQLLLKQLWLAAERGVIVRLLLDDFNSNAELDQLLLSFASHPNIAVRLINPMAHRKLRALNYLTDLRRINHRMHNKSMTFDRQISIIGGRNVGDEYLSHPIVNYNANAEYNGSSSHFADLDVLLIGDVVTDINASFEQYWRSEVSYDIETLVHNPLLIDNPSVNSPSVIGNSVSSTSVNSTSPLSVDDSINKIDFIRLLDKITPTKLEDLDDIINLSNYNRALRESTVGIDLVNKVPFRWVPISFISDKVDKLINDDNPQTHLVTQLRNLLGTPIHRLTIVSSYFVPTKEGVDTLIKLSQQGVQVTILTNSFNATDVAAVHSGYAQWRIPLIKAGIQLYELKSSASEEDRENKVWRTSTQSSTSLHAKVFAIDDTHTFIGSYNIDPRSANINTEMGVVIEDAELTIKLHDAISDDILSSAYKLVLTDKGRLQWQTIENNQLIIYDKEPFTDFSDTFWVKLLSYMPIDWLL